MKKKWIYFKFKITIHTITTNPPEFVKINQVMPFIFHTSDTIFSGKKVVLKFLEYPSVKMEGFLQYASGSSFF